jgi:hypothetical protein
MSQRLKRFIIFSILYKFILALSLCVGPTYANEADVHYYTFVMQNKNGVWELPTDKELAPGDIYRFQIVKIGPDKKWLALRGVFHFIKDPIGGVKVSLRKNLDQSPDAGYQVDLSLWNDENRDKTWEKSGRPQVQPLIEQMTLKKPGAPDPNLMRFLVLNNEVETSWKLNDMRYRIVRLHYLIKRSVAEVNKEDINGFSRFLKPSEAPTSDLSELKDWMMNQKSFKSAGYLGEADALHQAFYQDFSQILNHFLTKIAVHVVTLNIQMAKEQLDRAEKKRLQQANSDVKSHILEAENKLAKAKEMSTHIGKNQKFDRELSEIQARIDGLRPQLIETRLNKPQDNTLLLILIIVITIMILISIAALLYPEKLRKMWPAEKDHDDSDPYATEEQSIVSQSVTTPMSKRLKSARYVSREELSTSLKTLRNPLLERIIEIEKRLGIDGQNVKAKPSLLKDNTEQNLTLPHDSQSRGIFISQAELAGLVENVVEQYLATHFFDFFSESLKKLSKEEKFEEVVRQQVLAYLNNQQFKKGLNTTLESYAENHLDTYLKQMREDNLVLTRRYATPINPQTVKKTALYDSETRETLTSAGKPMAESQNVDSETDEVIEKMKMVLSSLDSVDKKALEDLSVCAEPCLFLNHVVADCLKLNQPVTHYQRLDHAIAELTEGKVTLIIPNVGDEFIPAEHNAVAQQTANKGKLNVVATLARPGIKCDNVVRRKAEVVQTV